MNQQSRKNDLYYFFILQHSLSRVSWCMSLMAFRFNPNISKKEYSSTMFQVSTLFTLWVLITSINSHIGFLVYGNTIVIHIRNIVWLICINGLHLFITGQCVLREWLILSGSALCHYRLMCSHRIFSHVNT